MSQSDDKNYELKQAAATRVEAPELSYRPNRPKSYVPRIGLIGCGGISKIHLAAYRAYEWNVVALCDLKRSAAEERQKEFYPEAEIFEDYQALLKRDDIDVVDIALHPKPRLPVIEAALNAGKHVLSQKPFALDLDDAQRLADLADEKRLKLAVNQNGRWAPYVSYALQAIRDGLIGDVQSVNIAINWDHTWCKDTPFEKIHHLILYDFAIHWFDMAHQFFNGKRLLNVYAHTNYVNGQDMKPPMLAAATLAYESGIANLLFDAHSKFGSQESISISGSEGAFRASGSNCACDRISLFSKGTESHPKLEGKWFVEGFAGTMGELLCAIEEDREPVNSARNNIGSLQTCFAAIQSANTGKPVNPDRPTRELKFRD